MSKSTAANLPVGHSEIYKKMGLVLGSEYIDTIGTAILENGTEIKEVILCLESGGCWEDEIENLLDPEVSLQYGVLSKDEWIAIRVPIAFCLDMVTEANSPEIVVQLKKPLESGRIRTFFLFETGVIATADASINPTRAHGIRLN